MAGARLIPLEGASGVAALPSFTDPAVQECSFPLHARLRAEQPVFHDPVTGFHVVSRYADVRHVLSHPDQFRSGGFIERARKGVHGDHPARMQALFVERGWLPAPSLSQQDGAIHKEKRANFQRAFRPEKDARWSRSSSPSHGIWLIV